ncbi:MAG: endonuclease [Rhodoglobus sp.]|nr:endonuclease [Rhodoglobus sp.]
MVPPSSGLGELTDVQLQQRQRDFAAVRRRVDAGAALVAAEVARRSTRELGYSGLAQREGARSAEQLVEQLAGVTPAEARAMVRVGELLSVDDPSSPDHGPAWLESVTTAVSVGELSVIAADAIRSGLGEPSETVSADALADVVDLLLPMVPLVPVRRLAAQARALRDALDRAGVAEREDQLRERRYLKLHLQSDGMTRLSGLLDPESAALVSDAFDLVTSPRRGGPRFVDPAAAKRAQAIMDDPRTTDQLLHDAFVEMIRIAGAADTGRIYAQRRPAVSIHVDRAEFEGGVGVAHIEGQTVGVTIATARRLACSAGAVPILFDGEKSIDVGRAQRTYTDRQRTALAARDGGCRFAGCDRPPSWCEAHHADEWVRDQGETSLDNGILLCRFHHLMVHNQGWRIEKRGETYVALPPPERGGPEVHLPTRNPVRARQVTMRASREWQRA